VLSAFSLLRLQQCIALTPVVVSIVFLNFSTIMSSIKYVSGGEKEKGENESILIE
jgi:hypothetical protein